MFKPFSFNMNYFEWSRNTLITMEAYGITWWTVFRNLNLHTYQFRTSDIQIFIEM